MVIERMQDLGFKLKLSVYQDGSSVACFGNDSGIFLDNAHEPVLAPMAVALAALEVVK
jgi:hypothetical protein